MGRWQALAIVAALALAALPAVGQGGTQPPAPEMPGVPGDAAQLYDDVQILRTIRTLDLSGEQLQELGQINARIIEEREDLVALREQMWEEHQEDIEAVLNAWMRGESPSSRAKSAADRAVNRVNEARADYEDARWDAAGDLYDGLTDDQQALVEGPGAARERIARTARLGGTESVGEYMLTEIEAIRDLMPDEFEMLATAEAQRIARAIFGPDARDLEQRTNAVLDILIEVYGWTPERYRNERPQLASQIEAALGLRPEAERPPISWDELMLTATSTRTPAVLAAITPAGGGEVE